MVSVVLGKIARVLNANPRCKNAVTTRFQAQCADAGKPMFAGGGPLFGFARWRFGKRRMSRMSR